MNPQNLFGNNEVADVQADCEKNSSVMKNTFWCFILNHSGSKHSDVNLHLVLPLSVLTSFFKNKYCKFNILHILLRLQTLSHPHIYFIRLSPNILQEQTTLRHSKTVTQVKICSEEMPSDKIANKTWIIVNEKNNLWDTWNIWQRCK